MAAPQASPPTDLFAAYARIRERCCELVSAAGSDALDRLVPACPDWQVRQLLTHLVATPAAVGAGRLPDGDINVWLGGLVAERAGQPVGALIDEWHDLDDTLQAMLAGMGGLLFVDVSVHEHDLRGALGFPDHQALETTEFLPRTLAAFVQPLQGQALAPIAVRSGDQVWQTSGGPPGWTLLVDPWEAGRALNSRRTAAELRALPAEGDVTPYVSVINDHLPLPVAPLGEG